MNLLPARREKTSSRWSARRIKAPTQAKARLVPAQDAQPMSCWSLPRNLSWLTLEIPGVYFAELEELCLFQKITNRRIPYNSKGLQRLGVKFWMEGLMVVWTCLEASEISCIKIRNPSTTISSLSHASQMSSSSREAARMSSWSLGVTAFSKSTSTTTSHWSRS